MIETVSHHAQDRIARSAGKPGRFGQVAAFNRGEHLLDPFRIAPEPAAAPPKDSLDYEREPDDRHDQDRPHDRAALAEVIDEKVTAARGFRFGSRRRRCCW